MSPFQFVYPLYVPALPAIVTDEMAMNNIPVPDVYYHQRQIAVPLPKASPYWYSEFDLLNRLIFARHVELEAADCPRMQAFTAACADAASTALNAGDKPTRALARSRLHHLDQHLQAPWLLRAPSSTIRALRERMLLLKRLELRERYVAHLDATTLAHWPPTMAWERAELLDFWTERHTADGALVQSAAHDRRDTRAEATAAALRGAVFEAAHDLGLDYDAFCNLVATFVACRGLAPLRDQERRPFRFGAAYLAARTGRVLAEVRCVLPAEKSAPCVSAIEGAATAFRDTYFDIADGDESLPQCWVPSARYWEAHAEAEREEERAMGVRGPLGERRSCAGAVRGFRG